MSEQERPALSLPQRPRAVSSVAKLVKSNRSPQVEAEETQESQPATHASSRTQVTFYMYADNRQRARATFRATSSMEGDETWSDFVEAAVMNEVARRERLHNEGKAYQGGVAKLRPGRRLKE